MRLGLDDRTTHRVAISDRSALPAEEITQKEEVAKFVDGYSIEVDLCQVRCKVHVPYPAGCVEVHVGIRHSVVSSRRVIEEDARDRELCRVKVAAAALRWVTIDKRLTEVLRTKLWVEVSVR